jgi:hypothetical protein
MAATNTAESSQDTRETKVGQTWQIGAGLLVETVEGFALSNAMTETQLEAMAAVQLV